MDASCASAMNALARCNLRAKLNDDSKGLPAWALCCIVVFVALEFVVCALPHHLVLRESLLTWSWTVRCLRIGWLHAASHTAVSLPQVGLRETLLSDAAGETPLHAQRLTLLPDLYTALHCYRKCLRVNLAAPLAASIQNTTDHHCGRNTAPRSHGGSRHSRRDIVHLAASASPRCVCTITST